MNIALVVPTIREHSIKRFVDEWKDYFYKYNLTLIIVEDNPVKTFDIHLENVKFYHYSWEDFDKELRENSWIIPRRNAAVRSFGFWQAYKLGFDLIVTLDDDCYPIEKYINNFENYNYFEQIISRFSAKDLELDDLRWETTVLNIRTRGLPYKNLTSKKKYTNLNLILNHGLWANIPDLDAINNLLFSSQDIKNYFIDKIIPKGKYFTMCGMNLAFKREAVPALYFLLMGEDENGNRYPYDRFDDIWAGIIFKKIADHLNYDIISGHPIVWHDRASDPFKNLIKESNGIMMNENFWKYCDEIKLTKSSFKECYKEIADKLNLNDEYFTKLKRAMHIWADLF